MPRQAGSSDTSTRGGSGSRAAASNPTLAGAPCVNPIRLRGYYQRVDASTGEVLALLGSTAAPRGIVLVACKDRRASCCPTCARLYERDAYHLIASGLRGGKTVPATVGTHPAVMLTLTAPSFGAVHGIRERGQPCKCGRHHQADDPHIGAAIDPATYRYTEQAVWNHYAPELWRRTVKAIRQGVASALGVPRSALPNVARVRFAKVAEFQRRGVVHYHAIIRIDGPDGVDSPPPAHCTGSLLQEIETGAADFATIALPGVLMGELGLAPDRRLRWGPQRDAVALDLVTCTRAAGYIAKYATKATETVTGGPVIKPIRSRQQLDRIELTEHGRTLIAASWTVGERTGIEGFKRWSHQFGYGGHTLTKSRQYSTTFAALRAARTEWRSTDDGDVIVRAQLTYAGRGHGRSRTLLVQRPGPPESKP